MTHDTSYLMVQELNEYTADVEESTEVAYSI
jgi:hypothetical protein